MSEKLISEKWLREYLDGYDTKVLEPAALQLLNNFYAELTKAPAVDAVEVVRCGKCEYWKRRFVNSKGFVICPASGMEITEDDFCSHGERRAEE